VSRRAVATGERSATARIALSYAQQAAFDLEGARASLEQAVALEPADALAWARLAEVRSSLAPWARPSTPPARRPSWRRPARTQTVLGFAHLTQVRTVEATAALRRAIELDASDPLRGSAWGWLGSETAS